MKKIVSALLMTSSALSFAEGEVRLIEGKTVNINCPDCAAQELKVAVDHFKTCPESLLNSNPDNPSLPRCIGGEVNFVYSVNGEDWEKVPLEFLHQGKDGFDYWDLNAIVDKPDPTMQYAIQYKIAGNAYWDNNQYNDYVGTYHLGSSITEDTIQLVHAERFEEGTLARMVVAVDNIAYQKKVKLIYTNDDGATWQVTEGTYVEQANNGYETWTVFASDLEPEIELQFALKYEVSGDDYWDNNDSEDYTLSPSEIIYGR